MSKRGLQTDQPLPLIWREEAGECRVCGGLSHWQTPLQSKTFAHPLCESMWPELSDIGWQSLPFVVSRVLGRVATVEAEPKLLPTSSQIGPCAGCGKPCQRYGRFGNTHCASCRNDPAGELEPIPSNPTGPCGWCGKPGVALPAVDNYWHCREHLFYPYVGPRRRP